MRRTIFDEEHDMFRESVRSFIDKEIAPNHEKWEQNGKVDKEMFQKAGSTGFLGMAIPEEYGGGGVEDFRYNSIINEEIQLAGVVGSGMCITCTMMFACRTSSTTATKSKLTDGCPG